MPKFTITERQVIRVDSFVDAPDEASARDMVNAMEATDYDSFVALEDHEIVWVQTES